MRNQSPSKVQGPTRRQFVSTTVVASVALGASPALSFAQQNSTRDKLNIGVIGAGGRGKANTAGVAHENIYALCDTNPAALAAAKAKHPRAKTFSDWREVIEDASIDAVVISTADHHHAPAAIAAMRAGKHVYCEKPLAHTVAEARLMQKVYAQRSGDIATQMGTQIHATDNYRRVVELVQGGAIGPVREAHVWCGRTINAVKPAVLDEQPIPKGFNWDTWLGPAEMRPYNTAYWKGGNLNWNRRWEFGNGVLGDMGSHLIDLPFWALDLTHPTSVESEGPEPDAISCPPWQVVTWRHGPRSGNENLAAPVKLVWYHGGEGMRRKSEVLQPQVGGDTDLSKWHIGVTFVGERGLLTTDYGKHVLSPGDDFSVYERPERSIAKSKGHYIEWTEACKSGGRALCNFEYSGRLIEHNLLGNVAHRTGTKLEWNHEEGVATGAPEAMQFVQKPYREGWNLG